MRPKCSRTLLAVSGIALAAVVVRALAFSGTELYGDEAYYWLWSLHPAPGYFDHPPLVAWLIAATSPRLGSELGVRLLFWCAGGLTVAAAALLARELLPEGSPEGGPAMVGAALLAAAAPLLNLLGGLALPDAPLTAAYTAALWLLARARGPRFLLCGLALGTALLAKYTAALLAPALLVLAVWDGDLRRQLATAWPWLGALLATALFAPCLVWNAGHDFESLRFQLAHGFLGRASLRSFLEYLAGQVLGCGPVAFLFGLSLLVRARSSPEKRLAAAVLIPLAVTTLVALRGRVEANWPALVYPGLAAAAGVRLTRGNRAVARALLIASSTAALGLLALFASVERAPGTFADTAVVERFHGWRALARDVRARSRHACQELGCDGGDPFLFTYSYQAAGELAFYGGFRRLGPASERRSQLDLWGAKPRADEPFFFVGPGLPQNGYRRTFRAEGEQPTERLQECFGGRVVKDVALTPFARYLADHPVG
ncbi:MAG TPA: glycosyltransferase family 39 protein [Anaeromyxobacteraceae bacterium]|nr:glycosyltransferase family 39 protein [Anaeromyxobacteraceae bacterium]